MRNNNWCMVLSSLQGCLKDQALKVKKVSNLPPLSSGKR